MQKLNDFSRSLIALEPEGTLIAVIETSLASWLVAGIVPGVERQPLKKLAADENALLKLLHRWRAEAEKAGRRIKRITRRVIETLQARLLNLPDLIPDEPSALHVATQLSQRVRRYWFVAHREGARHSQDHDRGLGTQASDRLVAARARGRGAGRRNLRT